MSNIMEGYEKGEKCNRNGCEGIIDEHEKEGSCSCHINPPCGYCTTPSEYCPVCDWDAKEEQAELFAIEAKSDFYKKMVEEAEKNAKEREVRKALFYAKYRGEIPAEEFEAIALTDTHFTMRKKAVFPVGSETAASLITKLRGTFGGRFTRLNDYSCEYIAYTD